MNSKTWMIYGANGYTGELIAREAARRGSKPVLAGRSSAKIDPLAAELELESRTFSLDDAEATRQCLSGIALVVHCAGPFSATAKPMLEACLAGGTHYLDITGEIDVFAYAHGLHQRAADAGIVLCPGAGFDVTPTDCLAAALSETLPKASHLALGFDSQSRMSQGTAKTSIEGLAKGGRIREKGKLVVVGLGYESRQIDFGNGEKCAMTIPWGDVATANYSTGIPNIKVFVPVSPKLVKRMRMLNRVRFLLGLGLVQSYLKRKVGKGSRGPSDEQRENQPTYVWGEVTNEAGERRTGRIKTANGYALTVTAALALVDIVFDGNFPGGYYTPSLLAGKGLIERLPGSGKIEIT
ncbi:MAG: saccharopine dehydrogenase NADP-binding domain-containing protein [Gammaproteobacteria bacterium]|nr:saccharopine dehydrogenase NADP-binding domain-containing protein [Gammaproteobacteria bacterium]